MKKNLQLPAKLKNHPYLLLGFLFFLIQKSQAATFYINDNDTKGDVYTTAVGNDSNQGTSASGPRLSIWTTYEKAQDGDTIFIDTGNYNELSSNKELLFANSKKIIFVIAGAPDAVLSKNPFPDNVKLNPANIYLDNDKPVDRKTYIQQLRKKRTNRPK